VLSRLLKWIEGLALALGGPGLFILAFLDSSFLSFPEVTDILIIVLVTKHPERYLWYTALPTIGSVLGCYVLYALARRGGEAFMRRRLSERHVERAFTVFRRYGLLAVAIPSILPPPVPFKVFVLAAGAARVRPREFLIAISLGRGVRYFGEGLLALWYGQWALDLLHEHGRTVSIWLAVIMAVLGFVYVWWHRKLRGDVDAEAGSPV
jgi:membrane protein YqaA with SNARE-associated domain